MEVPMFETNHNALQYSLNSLLIIISLSFLMASCGSNSGYNSGGNGGQNGEGSSNEVIMENTSFNPQTLTVGTSTEVTWINRDNFDHTVTSGTPGNPDGSFDSGTIGPDGTYNRTFGSADTVDYYCSVHGSDMTGTIIVE